ELEYQVRDSGAKFLISGHDRLSTALEVAGNIGIPTSHILCLDDISESPSASSQVRSWTTVFTDIKEALSWSWQPITTVEEAMGTTAIINYSSGTTGDPKGVELSHWNLISNTEQVCFKRAMVGSEAGRLRKERLDIGGERWLAVLPMYHAFGQAYFALTAPRLAAKVFVVPKFNITHYLLFMDIYRITFMNAVPTIFNTIFKQQDSQRFNLKAVENVTNGSAPLDPEIGRGVADKYFRPETRIKQGWGMTETTCSVLGFAPDDVDDGRSVGWLHPNCSAKIVPIDGEDFASSAPTGEYVGEIWVAGPNIMKGYWKRPRATADTIVNENSERWLRTGDIGYIDERGCFYIVDRLKELIKVKGLQVAPAELEKALITHPGVADCAVVGEKIGGNEYPVAFVVRANSTVTAGELINLVKSRFASHKWLTGGVHFIDSIPRTPSGKIQRRKLLKPLPKSKL
ncbi:hypothetical protein B0O99DRAFT_512355, partial [Bisporella sp. PMI_857]